MGISIEDRNEIVEEWMDCPINKGFMIYIARYYYSGLISRDSGRDT